MKAKNRIGLGAIALFIGSGAALASGAAHAALRVQLLVIGNNAPYPTSSASANAPHLAPLRYADDDAAAFYELLAEISDSAHLLTVMDPETQVRYPKLASVARPPTLAELRAAIDSLEERIEANRRRGDQNVLYFFFSGHGAARGDAEPALALLDGDLNHELLYEQVLTRLHADYVHVFVDACHAESIVRLRDSDARPVPVRASDADAFLVHSTLARFPHVGAIVAASSDAKAHEWDQVGHGVFTSELLSAMRGAADVNHDQRIEYSEAYAFLAAANRGVQDPRARLSVVARPPEIDRHAAIIDLSQFPASDTGRLTSVRTPGRLVEVEDSLGRQIVAFRDEPDFQVQLMIPTGTIYVHVDQREARFDSKAGGSVAFDGLQFAAPTSRARGAIEDAIRLGLLASEFGPRYYNGFVDQAADFAPVVFAAPADTEITSTSAPGENVSSRASVRPFELVAGLAISNTVAQAFDAASGLRVGARPSGDKGASVSLDVVRASRADMAEWQAFASIGWQWGRRVGLARGWIGAELGGGFVEQLATGMSTRRSGALEAGPELGAAFDITHGVSLWLLSQFSGMLYRSDGRAVAGVRPAVYAGASFAP